MRTPLAFVLTVLLVARWPAFAEDGHLDLTFGMDGKVTTDFSTSFVKVAGLAIQPDGKILVAGSSSTFTPSVTSVLARYDTDGGLDLTFGIGGKVSTHVFDGDYCIALAIQPDGKIVMLGNRVRFTPNALVGSFMSRYNSNGTLDTTFGNVNVGNRGTVIWLQNASALAIQSDGKIIVALRGDDLNRKASLMRYNSDGTLDEAFGFGGRGESLDPSAEPYVSTLAIQPDGKIVAVGGVKNETADGLITENLALARYDTNGKIDAAFGAGGIVRTDILAGLGPRSSALVIQSDGKVVAAGPASIIRNGNAYAYRTIALARYNSNGMLDTAFGFDGKVITAGGGVSDLAIQADGKIIAAGAFPPASGVGSEFGLARYGADGALDRTFGAGGIVTTDFFNLKDFYFECSEASAMALQRDGKIVVAGMRDFGWACAPAFAIARYNNDQSLHVDLRLDPERIRVGSSYVATFLGARAKDETYFDLRFRSPLDERDQVTLNWQRGPSAMHAAVGVVPGIWTVTGVRPHQTVDDHSANFMPVSATLTVVE